MSFNANIAPALASLAYPIELVSKDPENARQHDDRSIQSIADSLERFGQQKPIVVHNGVVIAGNGTVLAAERLGWTHLAVTTFTGTDMQARAFALADNRTAELSHWDLTALDLTLAVLADDDPSLALATGFTADDRVNISNQVAEAEARAKAQADAAPIIPMPSYTIVFERVQDKSTWDAFSSALAALYPSIQANGDRVVQFLRDRENETSFTTESSDGLTGGMPEVRQNDA